MKKIDEEKLNKAHDQLMIIAQMIIEYDKTCHTLTKQEKILAGGIVFNIFCPWGEVDTMGLMVDRVQAAAMIDRLVDFYQNPQNYNKPPKPEKKSDFNIN